MPDITYDVGRVSFVMKGAWNLATNYEKLDAVSYNGSLYIAKQDVPGGTAITNTTYWQLAAEKGDKGDTGGVDSVNGQQGDVWFPDSRQLISDGYTTDTEPFLMKGNDSDSDRFELAKKLGNTVCVNQLVADADKSFTCLTGTNTDKTLYIGDLIAGRKYIVMCYQGADVTTSERNTFYYNDGSTVYQDTHQNFNPSKGWRWWVFTPNNTIAGTGVVKMWVHTPSADVTYSECSLIDLTLWFGSNDRIPSDLLSHPENWGRYYAGSLDYNAGTLVSADGTVMRSIGRNMLNKANFVKGRVDNGVIGYASATTALSETATGISFTTNAGYRGAVSEPIQVSPNTQVWMYLSSTAWVVGICDAYDASGNWIGTCQRNTQTQTLAKYTAYFDVPAGAATIRFSIQEQAAGTVEVNDITISLYYSGEPGYNQYYPYTVLAEVDTWSEVLRGVEGSRDEKLPSGAITHNRAVIDLGTLNWAKGTGSNGYFYAELSGMKQQTGAAQLFSGISGKYVATLSRTNADWNSTTNEDKVIGTRHTTNYVCIVDSAFASYSGAQVATALSGVMLEYPLATPTTEQGTAFEPLVVTVKGGVLSWTNTKGIPVGQESHWFENLRKRVEDRLPDPPSADGTYRLTCTISGGVKTYSWEA